MSGIYIPNVCLPGDGDFELWIAVKKDGSFTYNISGKWRDGNQKAIPVPDHGRLGDLDALHKLLLERGKEYKGVGGAMLAAAAWCIANAPTIIPADKEGEG